MDKLTSYFELCATFNLAFVVSSYFINSICEKISDRYKSVRADLASLKKIHENNTNKLFDIPEHPVPNFADILKDLNTENEKLGSNIDNIESEINNPSWIEKDIFNFNYLCMFGAIYSLFFLLLIGFEVDFTQTYIRHAILILNIASIGILWWLFSDNKSFLSKLQSGYFQVIIVFFLSIIIALIGGWYLQSKSFYCSYNYTWFNKIFCVALPTSHFAYYFIATILKTRHRTSNFNLTLVALKTRCEAFAKELHLTLNVASKLISQPTTQEPQSGGR